MKNLYEFLANEKNVMNCHECPNKGQCNKDVCLVKAHTTINRRGFIPYNQAAYEERKLL